MPYNSHLQRLKVQSTNHKTVFKKKLGKIIGLIYNNFDSEMVEILLVDLARGGSVDVAVCGSDM